MCLESFMLVCGIILSSNNAVGTHLVGRMDEVRKVADRVEDRVVRSMAAGIRERNAIGRLEHMVEGHMEDTRVDSMKDRMGRKAANS